MRAHPDNPVTRGFLRDALRSDWNQRIFSGKRVPPPEVASIADAIA